MSTTCYVVSLSQNVKLDIRLLELCAEDGGGGGKQWDGGGAAVAGLGFVQRFPNPVEHD
jgi:hypothetical protein